MPRLTLTRGLASPRLADLSRLVSSPCLASRCLGLRPGLSSPRLASRPTSLLLRGLASLRDFAPPHLDSRYLASPFLTSSRGLVSPRLASTSCHASPPPSCLTLTLGLASTPLGLRRGLASPCVTSPCLAFRRGLASPSLTLPQGLSSHCLEAYLALLQCVALHRLPFALMPRFASRLRLSSRLCFASPSLASRPCFASPRTASRRSFVFSRLASRP